MSTSNWNIPFTVQNSQRRYPLASDSTSLDTSGTFSIPDDFLIGASIPTFVEEYSEPDLFFIRTLGAFDSGFTVTLSYLGSEAVNEFGDAVERAIDVAVVWIPRALHVENKPYQFNGVGKFSEVSGTITIGRFDDIDNQPSGSYTFELEATRFAPDVIRPFVKFGGGVYLDDGNGSAAGPFYNDIEFTAGENIRIRNTVKDGKTYLNISAIDGEGLSTSCECETEALESAQPILRINGIPPQPNGEFLLLSKECTELQKIEHGLRISDTCSKPCCGCDELEELTADIKKLGSSAASLKDFASQFDDRVNRLDLVLLGSRLREGNCEQ